MPDIQAVQVEQVMPVLSEAANAELVKETVSGKSRILFLRVDPGRQDIDPFLGTANTDRFYQCRDIWIMDSDGGNSVNMTKGAYDVRSADWSFDKSKIVFECLEYYDRGRPICYIYTMDMDGSTIMKISPGSVSVHSPSWSPDSAKIAYCKYIGAFVPDYKARSTGVTGFGSQQLFIFHYDTKEYIPVAFSYTNSSHFLPKWFPDSKNLAFLDYETRMWKLYRGDIVTGDISKLDVDCNLRYTSFMPWFSLSPDGNRIVYTYDFSQDYQQTGRELFLFNIDTNEAVQLTRNDYADDNPCFSPDGKQILFTAYGSTEETSGMFMMDIESKEFKKIPSNYGDMPIQWK